MKQEYFLIDFLKAIFAICVIAIHTNPIFGVEEQSISVYNLVISLAVPFFFATTGFLMGKKIEDFEYIKTVRRRYLRLYLIWNLVYLPITIWGFVYKKMSIQDSIIALFRGVFLTGEQFCSWPLWYLLSVIYGTFLIQILCKLEVTTKGKVLAACLLFASAYVLDHASSINSLFGKAVGVTVGTGRLLTGPCYILLGNVVAEWDIKKRNVLILNGGVLLYQL